MRSRTYRKGRTVVDETFEIDELPLEIHDRAMENAREYVVPEIIEEYEREVRSDIDRFLADVACYEGTNGRARIDPSLWDDVTRVDAIGGHIPDAPTLSASSGGVETAMVQVWNTGVLELQTYVERVNQAADDLTDDPTFDFNSDEQMSDLLSERQSAPLGSLYDAWVDLADQCLQAAHDVRDESIQSMWDSDELLLDAINRMGLRFTSDGELD